LLQVATEYTDCYNLVKSLQPGKKVFYFTRVRAWLVWLVRI